MLSKNKIKFLKSLHSKKNRDEQQLFIVEGEKSIEELLRSRKEYLVELYTSDVRLVNEWKTNFEQIELISKEELYSISTLKNPANVFAVCRQWKAKNIQDDFILMLDNIQDPGNLGTLIRLADWYGVKSIVCSENTVELFNPKVIQASMGSIFNVNCQYVNCCTFLEHSKLPIYGALLEGESIFSKKVTPKGILILGNEGNGISKEVKSYIQHAVTIPKHGQTESLNVAIAGAVLLSEFFRETF